MTYKRRTTFRRAFARLFPCVLFCLAVTGMVGASELLAEREILFPEAAAIALGALVAPRLAWRTSYPALLLSIALCAFSGILIVRVLPLPLAWQLAFAYLVGQLVLLASCTSFAPLISAVVLPVLLGTRSLVYPAAAILLTALLLFLRIVLEKTGIRAAVSFSPLPPPDRHDGIALCLRSLLTAAMCLIAVRTSLLYLVCPPILVAFTEFTRPNNAAMRTPLRAAALLCAAAAIGTPSCACFSPGRSPQPPPLRASRSSCSSLRKSSSFRPPQPSPFSPCSSPPLPSPPIPCKSCAPAPSTSGVRISVFTPPQRKNTPPFFPPCLHLDPA